MARLYGKTTKFARHVAENDITLEPQRFYALCLWRNKDNVTRTDGEDVTGVTCQTGSIIKRHKLEILVTPETIEPQQLYIGRLKLAFHDIFARPICGGEWDQASYGDEATESFPVTIRNHQFLDCLYYHLILRDYLHLGKGEV